jgi:hypothetical protein
MTCRPAGSVTVVKFGYGFQWWKSAVREDLQPHRAVAALAARRPVARRPRRAHVVRPRRLHVDREVEPVVDLHGADVEVLRRRVGVGHPVHRRARHVPGVVLHRARLAEGGDVVPRAIAPARLGRDLVAGVERDIRGAHVVVHEVDAARDRVRPGLDRRRDDARAACDGRIEGLAGVPRRDVGARGACPEEETAREPKTGGGSHGRTLYPGSPTPRHRRTGRCNTAPPSSSTRCSGCLRGGFQAPSRRAAATLAWSRARFALSM